MAKDCSDFSQLLHDLVVAVVQEDASVQNIDGALDVIAEDLPSVTRDDIVDSIVEVLESRKKAVVDVKRRLAAIKREARTNKNLDATGKELANAITEGRLPIETAKKKTEQPNAIKVLRGQVADLKAHLKKTEPAQVQRLTEQVAALDAKLKRMQKTGELPQSGERFDIPRKSAEHLKLASEKKLLQQRIDRHVGRLRPRSIFGQVVSELHNLTKSITTSVDISGFGRQGGIQLAMHPIRTAKAFPTMIRALATKKGSRKAFDDIQELEDYDLAVRHSIFFSDPDGDVTLGEENIRSEWSRHIPIISHSNRAYTAILNQVRMDSFSALLRAFPPDPSVDQTAALDNLADFVNVTTGRGSLGSLEKNAPLLNAAFFSPRWISSRFQFIFGKNLWQGPGKKETRRLLLAEYGRYLAGKAIFLWLAAQLGDFIVEDDPNSSDFLKLKEKNGNTRYDVVEGLSQTAVLISRAISGKTKSSVSGEVRSLSGSGSRDLGEVVFDFTRSKFSPLHGAAWDIIARQNVVGETTTVKSVAKSLVTPLSTREVVQSVMEHGIPRATADTMVSMLGVGVQTYGQDSKRNKRRILR
ncbi:MAG TPA: hypothetical protein ENH62_06775 [Marinobacter sp.]|uniref:Uncharacterized protein n=1 Tax=marine sediment metagenome TaxID=412755 RepID=A0A0F9STW8_9ZZZZ|nr:hypothetical protein [Marinobacter sp.]